ncbi:MAG: hypothetical protein ACK417_04840 [Bacteroidia bacterium]
MDNLPSIKTPYRVYIELLAIYRSLEGLEVDQPDVAESMGARAKEVLSDFTIAALKASDDEANKRKIVQLVDQIAEKLPTKEGASLILKATRLEVKPAKRGKKNKLSWRQPELLLKNPRAILLILVMIMLVFLSRKLQKAGEKAEADPEAVELTD